MARDLIKYSEIWKAQFPDYSFYFHDDYAVDTLFQQENWPEFPQLGQIMTSCIKFGGAIKIDVWRMLVSYAFGGFYSDFDNAPGPKFSPDLVHSDDNFFSLSDAWDRPSQWLNAMTPNHPIAFYTILEILTRVTDLPDVTKIKPVFLTGPDALKYGYRAVLWQGGHPQDNMIYGNSVHVASPDIQAHKISNKRISPDYVVSINRNEIVPLNTTHDITKEERIKLDINSVHWTKAVCTPDNHNAAAVKHESCWKNLYGDSQPKHVKEGATDG
jgi:hypothetical protein